MNGVEKPVRGEAEGLPAGDNKDDLPTNAMPPNVPCSTPQGDNEDLRSMSDRSSRGRSPVTLNDSRHSLEIAHTASLRGKYT